MRIKNLKDLFVEQLKDLYSAESQVQQAYGTWKEHVSNDDLRRLFDNHIENAKEHQQRIRQICGGLGVSPEGHKCKGMEGLVREGNDFLNEVSDDQARDAGLVAMAQRMEHYGMAGYGSARTFALHLDYGNAAQQLQQTLEEEARVDERMTELAESTLNLEAVA